MRIRNIEPLLTRENEIPLEDESVDIVVSVNTLHEFDDQRRIVGEMRRVLKKGGHVLIGDFKRVHRLWTPSRY